MCMLDEMRAKRNEIYVIARRRKAEKLSIVGSCARGEVSIENRLLFIPLGIVVRQ